MDTGGYRGQREDIALYNPKKAGEFTRKLIATDASVRWMPLQGMTPEQVAETMSRAKVYVDFGPHPGKDRIPREAASFGCCVLTGKRGAAQFFEDVNIADEFKFDETDANAPCVVAKIKRLFANYDTEAEKFAEYRRTIARECEQFYADLDAVFVKGYDDARIPLAMAADIPTALATIDTVAADPHVRLMYIVNDDVPGGDVNYHGAALPVITRENFEWLQAQSPRLRLLDLS